MFYHFNHFTCRIVPSTQVKAYFPQGFMPLVKRETPVFTFDPPLPKVAPCPSASVTPVPPAKPKAAVVEEFFFGVYPSNPRYRKVMQLQNTFLKDDGRLVWQKLGSRDRVAYFATLGILLAGSVMCARQMYSMIFPYTKEEEVVE